MATLFSSPLPRADSHLAVYIRPLSMEWMFSLSTSTSEICSFFLFLFFSSSPGSIRRAPQSISPFSSPRWLEIAALQLLTQNGPCSLFPLVTGRADGGFFFSRWDVIVPIYTLSHSHKQSSLQPWACPFLYLHFLVRAGVHVSDWSLFSLCTATVVWFLHDVVLPFVCVCVCSCT